MKLNKEKLSALSSLPNAKMWEEIRKMAGERGFTLPEEVPPPETMEKIRRAMSGAERISLSEAAKIMQNYRKR
jgi:hypothetical protein